ncbi:Hydroxyacylglutathione hydrolase, mitochondrial [Porphyridium purpureum]|uniref:hydroxyacylglutathione hydrolase n=1 Tax=Porphyridium purpureum TaxID=35688 RepID=A0A5J4YYY7_PORPP|nr:Hydroxyacylglutathione hydrolase, mitochondrial [Porphyridium purpureum]|eukprot:POR2953..scf209_3
MEIASMPVVAVECLGDNYAYVVECPHTRTCAVVDAVEVSKVMGAVSARGLELTHVLTTHKHWDHASGNLEMKALYPHVQVVGGRNDDVPAATMAVSDGDTFRVGSLEVTCLWTPCHTRGHICYYVRSLETQDDPGAVFTGDTLFIAGCGRFFEGSANDMCAALSKLASLPDDTRVYCGHEYTVANLRFALSIEPDSEPLQAKLAWANEQRSRQAPTIPSLISDEKSTNPFLRTDVPSVQAAVQQSEPIATMQALRDRKNAFK